ncbi:MAG: hypothetical protein IJ088_06970, partial [Clostridia bacterium]|nr:hypothetical protein [Clostridia bacterium]
SLTVKRVFHSFSHLGAFSLPRKWVFHTFSHKPMILSIQAKFKLKAGRAPLLLSTLLSLTQPSLSTMPA